MKAFKNGALLRPRISRLACSLIPTRARNLLATHEEPSNLTPSNESSIFKVPQPVNVDLESKTVSTVLGELPLSPLMDPAHYEARRKWRERKQPESKPKDKNKFRKSFARNAYVHALTTPVRRCVVTGTVVPSFLLQGFQVMFHPETAAPYYVPTDLDEPGQQSEQRRRRSQAVADEASTAEAVTLETSTVKALAGEAPTAEATRSETSTVEALAGDPPAGEVSASTVTNEGNPEIQTPSSSQKPKGQTGPTGYILARQDVLQQLVTKGSPFYGKYKALMVRSAQGNTPFTKAYREAIWREDMASYILNQLRGRVVEEILYIADLMEASNRKYLIKCDSWADIAKHNHRGCVLFFSDVFATTDANAATTANLKALEPQHLPLLSTMDIDNVRLGSKLPVHDMRRLLGQDYIYKLGEQASFFRNGGLFLLGRERTVTLQLELWKLQNYLSHGDPGAETEASE
ncbi:hypothetical protein OQA88_13632 [Cercophora sp. LCS_1]